MKDHETVWIPFTAETLKDQKSIMDRLLKTGEYLYKDATTVEGIDGERQRVWILCRPKAQRVLRRELRRVFSPDKVEKKRERKAATIDVEVTLKKGISPLCPASDLKEIPLGRQGGGEAEMLLPLPACKRCRQDCKIFRPKNEIPGIKFSCSEALRKRKNGI